MYSSQKLSITGRFGLFFELEFSNSIYRKLVLQSLKVNFFFFFFFFFLIKVVLQYICSFSLNTLNNFSSLLNII